MAIELNLNDWKAVRSSNPSAASYLKQKIIDELNVSDNIQKALDHSFSVIAQNPNRFPDISVTELANRRSFIQNLTYRLQCVRAQLQEVSNTQSSITTRMMKEQLIRHNAEQRNQQFIDDELDHQRNMTNEQNKMIDRIDESSATILHIAKGIGQGLIESNERSMITSERIDKNKSGIEKVTGRVTGFLKKRSTWMWVGCIVLTVIAIALLIMVI
jgi:hypothetical protein